jgi:microcystin-dependent protein
MSTPVYQPAIGQINLNFTGFETIQNVENVNSVFTPLQPVDELISPLTVAQYSLYNVELEEDNFGLDNIDYLGYKGGFISAGDKVNTKLGNFTITGNLTGHEVAYFYKNIDVKNTPIKNIKRKGPLTNFVAEVYGTDINDGDVMTVGDFREFRYPLGMIMMWSGTTESLSANLPYWRLCAPPDSGNTINGVFIPNLEGSFVVGAAYEDNNVYQPRDNTSTSFGPVSSLGIGLTGGYNFVYLTENEIPSHNHDINYTVRGGETTLTSTVPNQFRLYGGGGGFGVGSWGSASTSCISNNPRNNKGCTACAPVGWECCTSRGVSKPGCTCSGGVPNYVPTLHDSSFSIKGDETGYDPFTARAVSIVDAPLTITSITEQTLGGNTSHENRPQFYTLCYIINVGQER